MAQAEAINGLNFDDNIQLMNGAHILYTYTNESLYLENAFSFICNGLNLGQGVVYIDGIERLEWIKERLIDKGYTKEQIEGIIFANSKEFYLVNKFADYKVISEAFSKVANLFLEKGIALRTWSGMEWEDENYILTKLKKHEESSDDFIKKANCLTVCAYDGKRLTSSVQLELMKSHQYIMNDTELFISSLYRNTPHSPKILLGKALEESFLELNRYKEEISKLEQLNLIGQMAASISHEVRNPMTTVRGFLQFISQKPGCLDYQDYFTLMIEELDRANYIITEFLSLSKNHQSDFELSDINLVITSLLPLLKSDATRREVNINTELEEVPLILLDPQEIRQVVLNLVQNGLEVTPKGKELTLRTYLEDTNVILEIQDQGPGIPREVIEKIGTPFVTTKKQGTGLGLSVCYRILESHKASMTFKTSSEGTIFRIAFRRI